MKTLFNWEKILLTELKKIIPPDDKVHGLDHALNVRDIALSILLENEYSGIAFNREALIAGSYLHDIGYIHAGPFSPGSFEHIQYGMSIARKILRQIKDFPIKHNSSVIYLIKNHDNAKFSLPNHHLEDKPRLTDKAIRKNEKTGDKYSAMMLKIIKEADSREFTDLRGTERTFTYSYSRGFPVYIKGRDPSYLDPMNSCILSNLLIFPHLAWLNAHTRTGRDLASKGYIAAENWVSSYCIKNQIPYTTNRDVAEFNWRS